MILSDKLSSDNELYNSEISYMDELYLITCGNINPTAAPCGIENLAVSGLAEA